MTVTGSARVSEAYKGRRERRTNVSCWIWRMRAHVGFLKVVFDVIAPDSTQKPAIRSDEFLQTNAKLILAPV